MSDELELLAAWQAGDSARGDILVRRHFVPVFRFFASKLPALAEDLTQRTFLRCTENRDRVDGERGFRGYLFGIARRVLMDHLRMHYAGSRFRSEDVALTEVTGQDLEAVVAQTEQERLVLEALQELPIDYQITLELHYWEGLELKEIAGATDVAVGTVKSRLSRGRDLLARRIQKKAIRRELGESTLRDLAGWSKSLGDLLVTRVT